MLEPSGYIDYQDADGSFKPLTVLTHSLVRPTKLAENIRINLARDVPRFAERPAFFSCRAGKIAIVGSGPTLKETIADLKDFDAVLACGSAHDYLVRNGVVPTYALVADAGEEDKGNLSLPQPETVFLLASQCAPSLFEQLKDHRIEMWHYANQAAQGEEERELLGGEQSVGWGSTVTVIAVRIAMMLGFQHLHFFGFDSCYGRFGIDQHVCKVAGSMEYQKIPVKVGDEEFVSDLGLMVQAEQFFHLVEVDGAFFHSTIHGKGLVAAMVRHGDPGLAKFVSLA